MIVFQNIYTIVWIKIKIFWNRILILIIYTSIIILEMIKIYGKFKILQTLKTILFKLKYVLPLNIDKRYD